MFQISDADNILKIHITLRCCPHYIKEYGRHFENDVCISLHNNKMQKTFYLKNIKWSIRRVQDRVETNIDNATVKDGGNLFSQFANFVCQMGIKSKRDEFTVFWCKVEVGQKEREKKEVHL